MDVSRAPTTDQRTISRSKLGLIVMLTATNVGVIAIAARDDAEPTPAAMPTPPAITDAEFEARAQAAMRAALGRKGVHLRDGIDSLRLDFIQATPYGQENAIYRPYYYELPVAIGACTVARSRVTHEIVDVIQCVVGNVGSPDTTQQIGEDEATRIARDYLSRRRPELRTELPRAAVARLRLWESHAPTEPGWLPCWIVTLPAGIVFISARSGNVLSYDSGLVE